MTAGDGERTALVAVVSSPALSRDAFIDLVETGDDAGHAEIAVLFAAIARVVSDRKIAGIVRAVETRGNDVVYINRIFVELEIDGLATDETVSVLSRVQFLQQGRPIFCGEAVQMKR